ncbi:MAG: imelysin family protein [Myxococcota bacterium]
MKASKILVAASLCAAMAIPACGSDDDPSPDPTPGTGVINVELVRNVAEANANVALAAYNDSVTSAQALKAALETFQTDRTQANLDAAKVAWLAAREPYGQTEVYRFRLSPIDSTNYMDEDGPEGEINAWPLGEALIDYVAPIDPAGTDFTADTLDVTSHETGVNFPSENIISSTVDINADLLSNTATAEDERDVIAGYHAIEFLLWGQDLNQDGTATDGTNREESTPGNILDSGGHRPLADFLAEADGGTDAFADRRFDYLIVAVDKLIADLTAVRDGWTEGAAYRTAFLDIPDEAAARQRLTEILTGMGTLSEGELGGERMQIALASNSQEDEHSCFSDNTHRDIVLNAEGVRNSFYGDYAGYDSTLDGADNETGSAVDGYGLDEYLRAVGLGEQADALVAALDVTQTAYNGIDALARQGKPVDVQIQNASGDDAAAMRDTIVALNAQSIVIAEIATALGLGEVVDPEASACDTANPTVECP